MKILFAPDSFKGSLSSTRAIELLASTAKIHFPHCETIGIPMADGGEGTVEALLDTLKGSYESCNVSGPLGTPVTATYALTKNHTAIIEMAAASGLPLLKPEERNPLYTTSYGTGELILDAIKKGAASLLLSIGGSATNDGGMGVASALGIRFLDVNDNVLKPIGANLIRIHKIDSSNLLPEIKSMPITIMCDVKNPLTGPTGATYIYGPQKGASPTIADEMEQGMIHYASVLKKLTGEDYSSMESAGAAGGFSVPFLAFTKARLASGIDSVMETLHFKDHLKDVDFVITGEGRVDEQSVYGKVMSGVGKACKEKGIPACAIVGSMGKDAHKILDFGIESIFPIVPAPMELSECMNRSEELFKDAADRMFRFIKMGMNLKS
ncbi:MAG: glycerate kinase [Lachnospiraceae bacterium]|nr:glycerate kinase [Lachnospiraceae bacterium]